MNIVNYPDRIAYQKRGNEKILYQEEGAWLTMDQGNGYVYALASITTGRENLSNRRSIQTTRFDYPWFHVKTSKKTNTI